jgi:hypothetical protein
VERGEGIEKPALFNGVAGKDSKANELKLILTAVESDSKQTSVKGKYT